MIYKLFMVNGVIHYYYMFTLFKNYKTTTYRVFPKPVIHSNEPLNIFGMNKKILLSTSGTVRLDVWFMHLHFHQFTENKQKLYEDLWAHLR